MDQWRVTCASPRFAESPNRVTPTLPEQSGVLVDAMKGAGDPNGGKYLLNGAVAVDIVDGRTPRRRPVLRSLPC